MTHPPGYTYTPTPDWLTAETQAEAWTIYETVSATHSYPVPGHDETGALVYRLHPQIKHVADRRMTMAEYLAIHSQGTGRVTGGSSAKNAIPTPADKERISTREAKRAEKQRLEAERAAKKAAEAAEEERRKAAQHHLEI